MQRLREVENALSSETQRLLSQQQERQRFTLAMFVASVGVLTVVSVVLDSLQFWKGHEDLRGAAVKGIVVLLALFSAAWFFLNRRSDG